MSHPVTSAFSHYVFQRCNTGVRKRGGREQTMTDKAKAGGGVLVTPSTLLNPVSAPPTQTSTQSTTILVNAIVQEVTTAVAEVNLVISF